MYLKRKKYKVRLLKKKFFIDLWGLYKKKKKFRQNHFQRYLLWFSRSLDRNLYPVTKALKKAFFHRSSLYWSRPRLFPRDKFGRVDKRSIQYRRPLTFKKILKFYSTLFKFRKPFKSRRLLNLLRSYATWRRKTHLKIRQALFPRLRGNHLILRSVWLWRRALGRKISWINTRRYRIKPDEYRRIYLKVTRTRTTETVRQQYYYGFDSPRHFLAFFKRVETGYSSFKFRLGLEGLVSNLLYRCNLATSVRAAHLLIRMNAIYVNNYSTIYTRHKCLNVGDSFGVFPRYIRLVYKVFKMYLKRRLVKLNVPNYLEYNYKIMRFYIWRAPTRAEKVFLHHPPYIKPFPLKPTLEGVRFGVRI